MPTYQQYSGYRGRPSTTRGQLLRWGLYVAVLIVIILIVQGCFHGGDKQANNNTANAAASGTNVNDANGNSNTNAAANANTNAANTNSAPAATVETSFDVATQCDGAISQYGTAAKVALTFGGRGAGSNINDIIKILKDANVPASFFFTGTFTKNNTSVVQAVADAGYRVYNQSDSHTDFTELSESDILQELEQADERISTITGRSTKPFVRPPYGSVNDDIVETVKAAGYCPIIWTVDGLDWQATSTAETVRARVAEKARNGAIILLQVGSPSVTGALPGIIADYRSKGLTFVSLAELIGAK